MEEIINVNNCEYSMSQIYMARLENVELLDVNPKYMTKFEVDLNKSSQPYTFSLNFTLLGTANNNVTINVETHELVGNSYKRTFLKYSKALCDWIDNDKIIYPVLRNNSDMPDKCPVEAKTYKFVSINIGETFMISFSPFRKLRIKLSGFQTGSKENIFGVLVYVVYIERKPNKN